ncbi:NlpC/P60 family protein [Sphingomonas sp.]|uniref:C40 family peptidase n=1 Tax=Sphingomonas sp. TaxID=28214 RepID=UPI003AFF7C45
MIAPHYALPLDHGCTVPRVAIRASPSHDAPATSELLLGETFAMVDCGGEWAWGFCRHDAYVGYVPVAALGATMAPSHVVTAPAALVFAAPDIKSPVSARLPMGARLMVTAKAGDFLETADGFVHHRHAQPLERPETDPVAVAARLIGTPYRWGGRSGDGIDCSGLVQLAHALCGVALPRDSDQQRAALDHEVLLDGGLRRGDLIFLPGHVAIAADHDTVVHANAHWMATVSEPIAAMLARLPDRGTARARRLA